MKPYGYPLLAATFLAAACSPSAPLSNREVDLAVEQSHQVVKAGEAVTFTARASGVAGRDDDIRWESSGGDLELLNDKERHARIDFDDPGTYTVTASLYVDGDLIDQERAMVRVEPLS
jgi:plastocyanin